MAHLKPTEICKGYIFNKANREVIVPRVKRDKFGKYYHFVKCLHCSNEKAVKHGNLCLGHACRCQQSNKKDILKVTIDMKFANETRQVIEIINDVYKVRCLVCGEVTTLRKESILREGYCKTCKRKDEEKTYREFLDGLGVPLILIGEYKNKSTKTAHQCPICKRTDWYTKPGEVMRTKRRYCQKCNLNKIDSILAIVLKQVLEKKLGAKTEEKIGKNQSFIYDIIIEDKKEVIEIQSRYHDGKEEKDLRKRKNAEDAGYIVNYFDVRKDTPVEACREYIYDITPDMIIEMVDFSRVLKQAIVQLDLDGKFIKKYEGGVREIAIKFNIKSTNKLEAATRGKNRKQEHIYMGYLWYKEDDYIKKDLIVQEPSEEQKSNAAKAAGIPVVQLNEHLEYISRFSCASEAGKRFRGIGTHISQVCKSNYGRKTYRGSVWMYEEEYEKMTDEDKKKILEERKKAKYPVVRIDLNGENAKIYLLGTGEVIQENGGSVRTLRKALGGKNGGQGHKYGDYLWYWLEEYMGNNFKVQEVTEEQIINAKLKQGRPVVIFDKNHEFVMEVGSLAAAAKALGTKVTRIHEGVTKRRKTVKGYTIEYKASS